jgi:hypothetical protein
VSRKAADLENDDQVLLHDFHVNFGDAQMMWEKTKSNKCMDSRLKR